MFSVSHSEVVNVLRMYLGLLYGGVLLARFGEIASETSHFFEILNFSLRLHMLLQLESNSVSENRWRDNESSFFF